MSTGTISTTTDYHTGKASGLGVGFKWADRRPVVGLGGELAFPVSQIATGGPNARGRRKRAVDEATVDYETSPSSDSGWCEQNPEGVWWHRKLGDKARPGMEQPNPEPWVPWGLGVEKTEAFSNAKTSAHLGLAYSTKTSARLIKSSLLLGIDESSGASGPQSSPLLEI